MKAKTDEMDNFFKLFNYNRFSTDAHHSEILSKSSWMPIFYKACDLRNQNNINAAFTLLENYLSNNISYTLWKVKGYFHMMTVSGINSGDYNIIKSFENSLYYGIDDYTVYADLGNSYNAIINNAMAETCYSIAIDLKNYIIDNNLPDHTNEFEINFFKDSITSEELYTNRAAAKCGKEQYYDSLKDCEIAETYNSDYVNIKIVRGICYFHLNEKILSLEYLKSAVKQGSMAAPQILKNLFNI